MKKDYSYILINNETRVIVFYESKVVTNYSIIPKDFINILANKLGLYLHYEMCMYTGKKIYTVGVLVNDKGGIRSLFKTYSKARLNKFVCNYTKGA